MRLTLNLSPSANLRERFALLWAIPATILGGALLFFLCRGSLREFHEYRSIEEQLKEVQAHAADLRSQEATLRRKLESSANEDLLRRAKFLNELIDQRVLSVPALSARLAGLLPESARLTTLSVESPKEPSGDYTLRMGISAKSEEAVDTFLGDLEDAPDFKDVSIINQGFQGESAETQEVNLICTARFLPGAELAMEEESQESEHRGQAAAGKKQESGDRSQKSGAGSQKSEAGGQKAAIAIQKPAVAGQKAEKPGAQESTPTRKPNI